MDNHLIEQVNIYEAKRDLSKILKRVQEGRTVIISNHNKPVAELRPIAKSYTSPRPFGLAKGEFKVSPDFDDPLPEDILKAFEGG